jgi:hypothetical protein
MNQIPIEIIFEELFPKLQLSDILNLVYAYPPWLELSKRYIMKVGRDLRLENIQSPRNVFDELHFKNNLITEFHHLKNSIPVTLYLLSIGYDVSMDSVETDIKDEIEKCHGSFIKDIFDNLDIIQNKRIIRPSTARYIQQNDSSSNIFSYKNPNYKVLDYLFPRFQKKMDKIISDFIINHQIPEPKYFVQQSKKEINKYLIRIFK